MDVRPLLEGAFEEEVLVHSGRLGVEYTTRVPGIGLIQIFWPQIVERANPWPRIGHRFEVSVNGKDYQTLEGQDELAAWVSLLYAGRSFSSEWHNIHNREFWCSPEPDVLMRVMCLGIAPTQGQTWGQTWGFQVKMPDETIRYEDCGPPFYRSVDAARRMARHMYSTRKGTP